MGCAPLRRGPDRLEFWLQGTMLKVAPVSTKYLSLVNSSVRNIKPAFAGKCIAVAVACVEKLPNWKKSGGKLVFLPRTGQNAPVSPIGVVVVKFAHAIARVLKRMKIWMERGRLLGRALPPQREIKSSRVMFARFEKVGKVQRFVGHSSHEEYKLEATVGQKNGRTDVASLEQNKNQ